MEVIDGHANITEDGWWDGTGLDAGPDALLRQMDSAGIHKALLLPIRGRASNRLVARVVKRHSDRFFGFGNLSVASWQQDLREIVDLRLKGIKFHPRFQQETLQQWDQNGVLEGLATAGLTLNVCGWLQSACVPVGCLTPIAVDRIAKQYSRLNIILSHLGGHRYWDAFFAARSNGNLYLDSSYFTEFFQGTSLETDFFASLAKIDQKIIYGSDFPEVPATKSLDDFRRKATGPEIDLQAVFSGNLLRALSPREKA